MGRIRTIKPDLFRHEALFEAEQDSHLPLRLVFIGLLTCCDREGRFKWRPRQLKLDILPYDDILFETILNALVTYGFVIKYIVEGECYGCIPTWHKHQCINNKERDSLLPVPPDSSIILSDSALPANHTSLSIPVEADVEVSIMREERVDDASSTRHQHLLMCLGESKGEREGNKEKKEEQEGSYINSALAFKSSNDEITQVFQHWQIVMQQPHAKLDVSRKELIRKALHMGYSVETLCEAITGCSLTPHNRGENNQQQRYDGLHIILRNADQIDRFRHNARHPPRMSSGTEAISKVNQQVMHNWLIEKVNNEEM